MQNRHEEFLSRNRSISERLLDEASHHHASALALLKRFPVHLFQPGGEFHHPGLWEEYQTWAELLGCTNRLDQQTYWRFEDWDKRCHAHVRRSRWSQQKFDFHSQHRDPAFKRFFVSADAVRRHYETLGLPPTATNEEIKAAYRRLATEHHPDKDGGDTARMQQINAAYDELRRLRRF
jgi:DnaJ-like protein